MNFRFSLPIFFFAIAFIAALVSSYSFRRQVIALQAENQALRQELNQSRPIGFQHVAQQIRIATQPIARAEIGEIHYNPLRDRYLVEVGWTNPKTNETMGTTVAFEPDGEGRYVGRILTKPFSKELIKADGSPVIVPLVVTIKDSVSAINDIRKENMP